MRPSTSGTMPGVKPPTTMLETISETGAVLTVGSSDRDRLDQEGQRASAGPKPARSARWPVSSGPTIAPRP